MNYELAKQLWEAGYLFKRRGDPIQATCLCTKDVCEGIFGREFRFEGNLYPEPTLSELIEACGDELFSIQHNIDKNVGEWYLISSVSFDKEKKYPHQAGGPVFYSDTPEEAVARLWVQLNKKHD